MTTPKVVMWIGYSGCSEAFSSFFGLQDNPARAYVHLKPGSYTKTKRLKILSTKTYDWISSVVRM